MKGKLEQAKQYHGGCYVKFEVKFVFHDHQGVGTLS